MDKSAKPPIKPEPKRKDVFVKGTIEPPVKK